jgi:hypothetical protein
MAMIENVTPILRVENLEASRRYYIQTLGFSLDWDTDGAISVSRDRKSIMLCEGEQGQPGTWLWIGVEDAMHFMPNSWLRARTSEARRGISAGPTSLRSQILTAMFFALGLRRSLDRRTEISSPDLTSSLVPAIGVVSRPRLGG